MRNNDMAKMVLTVNVEWDAEARMFVASSDDIPGLATEAASFEKLVERVMAVTPELLHDNGITPSSDIIHFNQDYYQKLSAHCA